jgi:hypothetical protein
MGLARTFGGLLIGHVLVTSPFVLATVSASLARFREGLQLQDFVGFRFSMVREVHGWRSEESFLRHRELEPEGHVSDGARGRLLPAA